MPKLASTRNSDQRKAIAAAREIKRDAKRCSGIRFTPRGRLFVTAFRKAIHALDLSFRSFVSGVRLSTPRSGVLVQDKRTPHSQTGVLGGLFNN